jgi:hypothetical protein
MFNSLGIVSSQILRNFFKTIWFVFEFGLISLIYPAYPIYPWPPINFYFRYWKPCSEAARVCCWLPKLDQSTASPTPAEGSTRGDRPASSLQTVTAIEWVSPTLMAVGLCSASQTQVWQTRWWPQGLRGGVSGCRAPRLDAPRPRRVAMRGSAEGRGCEVQGAEEATPC